MVVHIKSEALKKVWFGLLFTLFEIFIFCPKIQLWFLEKIVDFFEWKTRENVVVLNFLAIGVVDDNVLLDLESDIRKSNMKKGHSKASSVPIGIAGPSGIGFQS